jgi:hypothetical protein
MSLFQHRAERDESLTLGADTDGTASSGSIYAVFSQTS